MPANLEWTAPKLKSFESVLNVLAKLFGASPGRPGRSRRWRITGPYLGLTGYDRMVRSLVPHLRARGVEVELRQLQNWTPTQSTGKLPRNFAGKALSGPPDCHLHFCLPTQVVTSPECPNINYTMFEADRIPAAWADAAVRHDLIVVPTESSRLSWLAAGVEREKIQVCPQGTDFELFSPHRRKPLALQTSDGRPADSFRHRFLNVAEMITRKNVAGLLRAWLRATSSENDAVLILKPGFYTPGSREAFARTLQQLETAQKKSFREAAPLIICENDLSEADMPRLYQSATHYWSMSHGEGFDLPMMEAAACDLQLIAPAHSSYPHYLTDAIAHLLPVREIAAEIPEDAGLAALFRGSKWWEPDEDAAVNLLREILTGRARQLASPRAALLPEYTWPKMAERLIATLVSVGMQKSWLTAP